MRSSEAFHVSCPTATLALFTPESLAHRSGEVDWFLRRKELDAEVTKGSVIVAHGPMGGVYFVRFTRSGLRASEAPHVVSTFTSWIEIASGALLCADLGCLPAASPRDDSEAGTARVRLAKGRYRIDLHAISTDEALDRLPHLVVELTRLTDDERAPRRALRQLEPWKAEEAATRPPRRARPTRRQGSPAPSGPLIEGVLDLVAGSVAIFDPGRDRELRGRPRGWLDDEEQLQDAMAAGDLVLLRSRGQGFHQAALSVFLGGLPESVRERAKGESHWGRLRVTSGAMCIGGIDRIPGPRSKPPLKAWTTRVPRGDYGVEVIALPPNRAARQAAYALVLTPVEDSQRICLPKNLYQRGTPGASRRASSRAPSSTASS